MNSMSILVFSYDTLLIMRFFILIHTLFCHILSFRRLYEDLTNTMLPELSMEYWRIFFCCLFTCRLVLLGKEHSNHIFFYFKTLSFIPLLQGFLNLSNTDILIWIILYNIILGKGLFWE